jgi:hypothetical protein
MKLSKLKLGQSIIIASTFEAPIKWLTPKGATLYRDKVLPVLSGNPLPKELNSAIAFMGNFLRDHSWSHLSKAWKKVTGKTPFSSSYILPFDNEDYAGLSSWSYTNKLDQNISKITSALASTKDANLKAFFETLLSIYHDIKPVIAKLDELTASTESRKKERTKQNFMSTVKDHASVKNIDNALRAVCDKLHSDLVKFHYNNIEENLNHFIQLISDEDKARQLHLRDLHRQHDESQQKYRKQAPKPFPTDKEDYVKSAKFIEIFKHLCPNDLKQYFQAGTTKPLKDLPSAITKSAQSIAKDMEDTFVSKQVGKLAAIVDKRNDFAKIEVLEYKFSKGAIEADVKLTFGNNDSFVAHTIIVFVTNQQGTHFFRYPTTFHDAVLNGKSVKKVDEAWMNTEFPKKL